MSLTIMCTDEPLYIKENATIKTSSQQTWYDSSKLLQDGLEQSKYATLERNFFKLDGTYTVPNSLDDINQYCSSLISNEDGKFEDPGYIEVRLTLRTSQRATSNKITIVFDEEENVYPTDMQVYVNTVENSVPIIQVSPTSANYIIDFGKDTPMKNTAVKEVTFTVYAINKPHRYLKISSINLGNTIFIKDKNIKACKLFENVDLSKLTMPSNELTFEANMSIKNKFEDDNFQINVYKNNKYWGLFYLNQESRVGENHFSFSCFDAKSFFKEELVAEIDLHSLKEFYNFSRQESLRILTEKSGIKVIDDSNIPDVEPILDNKGEPEKKRIYALTRKQQIISLLLDNWCYLDSSRNNKIYVKRELEKKLDNAISIDAQRVKDNVNIVEDIIYSGIKLYYKKRSTESQGYVKIEKEFYFKDESDSVGFQKYDSSGFADNIDLKRTVGSSAVAKLVDDGPGWKLFAPYYSPNAGWHVGPDRPYVLTYEFSVNLQTYYDIFKNENYVSRNEIFKELDIGCPKNAFHNYPKIADNLYKLYVKTEDVKEDDVKKDNIPIQLYTFDMVLENEKCGDLIEVELPRYGKVLGYLRSINVDLTKPKNIATVEVFV